MIVSFEGIDGCGKSSVIKHINELLTDLHIPHIMTAEPYAYRDFIFNSTKKHPLEELALWCADRNKHINEVIKPILLKNPNTIILCDRYIHSTIAYQYLATGIPVNQLYSLCYLFAENFYPNKVYYLDVDINVAMKRVIKENSYDYKSKEWFYNLQSAYMFAFMNQLNVEEIDANKDLDIVVRTVMHDLQQFIRNKKVF